MLTTLHTLAQMDVVDRNGEKVGRIRDVLLDPESGRCDYLLLGPDTGPFGLGGGDGNYTPIPVALIRWKDNYLSLDATRDIIQGAPSFSPKNVGMFSGDYRNKLDSFWGVGKAETRHETAGTAPAYARREEEVRPVERREAVEPEFREERRGYTEGEEDIGYRRSA